MVMNDIREVHPIESMRLRIYTWNRYFIVIARWLELGRLVIEIFISITLQLVVKKIPIDLNLKRNYEGFGCKLLSLRNLEQNKFHKDL